MTQLALYDDLILLNKMGRLGDIAENATFSRSSLVNRLLDSRRDYDRECGYPDTSNITPEMYNQLYERDAIANRVVDVWPKECWAVQPTVYEDEDSEVVTPFEEGWDNLSQGLRECGKQKSFYQDEEGSPIWELLSRADSISGIGHYGVILMGFDDKRPLEEPIEPGKAHRLLYLSAFHQALAPITAMVSDQGNPRYGKPEAYNITLNDPSVFTVGGVFGATTATVKVHWSRVIHLADLWTNSGISEVYAPPRMRPVINHLQDLSYKLYGGSAEMFWRGAFPGLSFETHPQLGGDVELDTTEAKEQYEQYINGLQRVFAMSGVTVRTVAPSVVDPSNQINTRIQAICIQLGIPMRIFMGSERGELASSQDSGAWDGRVNGRRTGYITPRIIVPFVDRLIYLGVLPQPQGYSVFWKRNRDLTEMEQANLAGARVQAVGAFVQSGAEQLITPSSFFTRFMGMDENETEAMLQEKRDEILEEEPADPLFAQLHPQGVPGVSAPPLGPLDQSAMGGMPPPGMEEEGMEEEGMKPEEGMEGEEGPDSMGPDGGPEGFDPNAPEDEEVPEEGQEEEGSTYDVQLPEGVTEEDVIQMAEERGVDPAEVFAAIQDAMGSQEDEEEEPPVTHAIPPSLKKWKEKQGQSQEPEEAPEEGMEPEVDEEGNPIEQGFQTDEQGNPIDEAGNPLPTDEAGNPVDEMGNPLGQPAPDPTAILERIQAMREKWGSGGIEDLKRRGEIDKDGNPIGEGDQGMDVDENGNPLEQDVDEEGNLLDEDGNPVEGEGELDEDGNPVETTEEGDEVDEDGNLVEGEEGDLIESEEGVDDQGNPIEQEEVDEDGNPIEYEEDDDEGNLETLDRRRNLKRPRAVANWLATNDDCGAGREGAPGFQPGNTCASDDSGGGKRGRGRPQEYFPDPSRPGYEMQVKDGVPTGKYRPISKAHKKASQQTGQQPPGSFPGMGRSKKKKRPGFFKETMQFGERQMDKLRTRYPRSAGKIVSTALKSILFPTKQIGVDERGNPITKPTSFSFSKALQEIGPELLQAELIDRFNAGPKVGYGAAKTLEQYFVQKKEAKRKKRLPKVPTPPPPPYRPEPIEAPPIIERKPVTPPPPPYRYEPVEAPPIVRRGLSQEEVDLVEDLRAKRASYVPKPSFKPLSEEEWEAVEKIRRGEARAIRPSKRDPKSGKFTRNQKTLIEQLRKKLEGK